MMGARITLPRRLWVREAQTFLALTIIVGVLAGLSAVLFTLAIGGASRLLFGLTPSALRLVAVPATVSLVSGVLLAWVFPEARGSGVPQTKAAYHLQDGVIPLRAPLGKFLTGVLCIASGHSMGREGPSVQIGGGLASVIGQWLRLSPARVKALVPVGAAAALSAAFNTPVAAVLFALEEIIGDMNAALLGSTVVASVSAVIVERSILGDAPLFRVPAYHLVHPAELVAYALLGVAGGVVSVVFTRSLLKLRHAVAALPAWTRPLQPAMGGLAIGLLLLVVPEIMGVGYEYVDQALNGGLAVRTMLVLCTFKLIGTVISYAAGNAGGIFAPSLYIGAMAGGVVGSLVNHLEWFPAGDVGAYALVGMGTSFAGIIRAPMTSVFMIFEITQDYQILVPLMVANLLSFLISRRYQPVPAYQALLQQDGVHLPAPASAGGLGRRRWVARDVMAPEVTCIPLDATVEAAWRLGHQIGGQAWLVGTPERIAGWVTRDALQQARDAGFSGEPVARIVDDSLVHVHPDHGLDLVLERLSLTPGLLPVVSRFDARRVEGVITAEGLASRLYRLSCGYRSSPPQ